MQQKSFSLAFLLAALFLSSASFAAGKSVSVVCFSPDQASPLGPLKASYVQSYKDAQAFDDNGQNVLSSSVRCLIRAEKVTVVCFTDGAGISAGPTEASYVQSYQGKTEAFSESGSGGISVLSSSDRCIIKSAAL